MTYDETIGESYITRFNDRLDKICRKRYGTEGNDVIVFVIEQNPSLEEQGILLTPGLKIALPDRPTSPSSDITTGQIYLWT